MQYVGVESDHCFKCAEYFRNRPLKGNTLALDSDFIYGSDPELISGNWPVMELVGLGLVMVLAKQGNPFRPFVCPLVRYTVLPLFGKIVVHTVRIDSALKTKCPRVALGCLSADVEAKETSPALENELRVCEQSILSLPDPRSVLESPAILATRSGYKALGKDPARYRGSAEALIRRIIAGKGLPRIHAVVDIINIVSVESRLPIGLYDLAHVKGNITFRAGRVGETYKGIGKYDLNLEDLPLFADELGPHGSATSDSERTMVTPATRSVFAILVSFGGSQNLERHCERLKSLLAEHASGTNFQQSIVE